MTAAVLARTVPTKQVRWDRRAWGLISLGAVAWSVGKAGIDPTEVFNARGVGQLQAFFSAMFQPDLSPEMLKLTVREAGVTIGYALVGTAVALAIGIVGGVMVTERVWQSNHGTLGVGRIGLGLSRFLFAVPRSMHEVVFGLILVNILGLDPLVAVLAIGIPFGAVIAKVFAELMEAVPTDTERQLRAQGAGRVTALLVATMPRSFNDLLSYSFYRLECGLRSAAVLGIVGAGGIGFQLALSFQSLRYDEMWTLLWALIIISGLADRWSSTVRRRRSAAFVEMSIDPHGSDNTLPGQHSQRPKVQDRFVRWSALLCAAAVPVAIWRLGLNPANLWSDRSRSLARELVVQAFPPSSGRGGFFSLITDSIDTIALAVLSTAMAWALSSPVAFLARRPPGSTPGLGLVLGRLGSGLIRFVLLICRTVPPPVWAFVIVFVLFPGLWPGAVALAIYNFGVLGRLQAEVVENTDPMPATLLTATGASSAGAMTVATVPAVASRFAGLGLYRWEVAVRETVIVGVVGAAGLGRRLDQQTTAFDYDGLFGTILALLAVTVLVDIASAAIRRTLL